MHAGPHCQPSGGGVCARWQHAQTLTQPRPSPCPCTTSCQTASCSPEPACASHVLSASCACAAFSLQERWRAHWTGRQARGALLTTASPRLAASETGALCSGGLAAGRPTQAACCGLHRPQWQPQQQWQRVVTEAHVSEVLVGQAVARGEAEALHLPSAPQVVPNGPRQHVALLRGAALVRWQAQVQVPSRQADAGARPARTLVA